MKVVILYLGKYGTKHSKCCKHLILSVSKILSFTKITTQNVYNKIKWQCIFFKMMMLQTHTVVFWVTTPCNHVNGYCFIHASIFRMEHRGSIFLQNACNHIHGCEVSQPTVSIFQYCKNFKSLTLVFCMGPVQISAGFQLPWVCSWFSNLFMQILG